MGSKTKGHKAKTKNKSKPDSVHSNNNRESGGGKIIKDARFASLHSDPRFQKVPKRKTKVVIDSPALSEEDGTEEESDTSESDTSEMPQMDSDGELEEEEISESGSTTEEEDIDIDYEDGEPEMQEENIPMIEKETRRLAVVNMDWRHVKSGDGSDGDGEGGSQDMEVTFNTGLEDISKRILEKKDKQAETVWEAYLQKRREKKKAKKNKSKYSSEDETDNTDIEEATEEADDFFVEEPSLKKSKKERKKYEDTEKEAEASRAELELLLTDGADTGLKGYNLKAKKAKGKKQKEVLDVEKIPVVEDDPRFSALFTSPLFALDPTDPRYKRSATYARQIAKKLQKGERQELAAEDTKIPTDGQLSIDDPGMYKAEHENSDILPSKEKHNLSSMVRSVKMKLKQVQLPSERKVSKKSVSGKGG
ncbi:hypothetical protein GOBAR_AA32435 [Gossypium barbadense]|uniref:NUC153 domain-containing protein n=1 Tax=Gossypium barbadense TaxID=3634 RepID=A0A2P5WAZ1_GOSBA|nr:hypothetical protein GOBAR_AA32435 [Gossypium barbadense]